MTNQTGSKPKQTQNHRQSDRSGPLLAADGQGLKRLIEASLAWLRYHQAAINALNVFPVPDGDTGTNMLLTMQSAWAEIKDSPSQHAGDVIHGVAHGALMGARGNSGVILSQLWRGLARSLAGKQTIAAADLAKGMQEASDTAYKGVIKPVEGTILTVSREAARAAAEIAREENDLVAVMDYIVGQAKQAVARTPSQLPVLAEAGVVDSGGQGLFVIFEGMLRYLRGETVLVDDELAAAVDLEPATAQEPEHAHHVGYGYDVQFILVGQDMDVDQVRNDIDAMGDSTLVVGDAAAIKVHVHVPDPGVPISYAVKLGSLRDVVVEDMQAQYQEFVLGRSAPPISQSAPDPSDITTVAVMAGDGLQRVFESLGVGSVVCGGQTMNPSTQELVRAVEAAPGERVIILPNNSNVVMAAQQAAEVVEKQAAVVPTCTIPQGISALLALNPQASLESNLQLMNEAIKEVDTGEITTATRSVEIDGVKVAKGQIIGLVNDRLVTANSTIESVIWPMLEEMNLGQREILTLYYGDEVPSEQAAALSQQISQRYPEQEIEVIGGEQPFYHYILSVE